MASPDFILTPHGLTRPALISFQNNDIDMIIRPKEGMAQIMDLYDKCQPKKSCRFKFILSWFSHPRIDASSATDEVIFDCFNQWEFLSSHYDSSYQDHFKEVSNLDDQVDIPRETSCCCSQSIQHRYYFRNRLNGNVLLIGSSCIKKFGQGSRLMEDYDRIRKIFRSCQGCKQKILFTTIRNGLCSNCSIDPPKDDDKQICQACLSLRKCKYGRCKHCFKDNLPKLVIVKEEEERRCRLCQDKFYSDADWKDVCISCYSQHRRSCNVCEDDFFAIEDWRKICSHCYRQGHRSCFKCKQCFILRTEETGKLCGKCYPGDTSSLRKCQQCHQDFKADQDWKKACPECYQKSSAECVSCHRSFFPKGSWHKKCYSCWKQTPA